MNGKRGGIRLLMALYQTGSDLVFCHQLVSSSPELTADAAMGVANMTKLLASAVRMSDTNIIEALCAILVDDQAPWFYVRINALRALNELCRIIPKAAYSLVEAKTFAALRSINKRFKENPIEAQRLACACYRNLQNYHVSRRAMVSADFVQELVSVLALVSDNLRIEHIGLRTALCTLVAASVTDDGADVYLALGTIDYMVNNRLARYAVGAWEPALHAVFSRHPSAKFAYTGRLEINDFTREGFYVQKRIQGALPQLSRLLALKPPHKHPVYVCNFHTHSNRSKSDSGVRIPYHGGASASPRGSAARGDAALRDYLTRLRVWFGDPGKSLQYLELDDAEYEVRYRAKCTEVSSSLLRRAQLLAEFVATQMSGARGADCRAPTVDMYMHEVMSELGSCVVPLGSVTCGGPLERCVLYKVLADRVGLPCALRRRAGGQVCCEVAVPEIDPESPPGADERYPAGLLRANYVVDVLAARVSRAGSPGTRGAGTCSAGTCARPYVARRVPDACLCTD